MTAGRLILTHGAGSNRNAPLLVAIERALSGVMQVDRVNLAFREARPNGPPMPSAADRDRAGLRELVEAAAGDRVFLGGHSYGGRQSTILASEQPGLVAGLLLLSYPLHPPRKPDQLRTAHFPKLQTPSLFVQGARDPFGSIEEMEAALALIPARTKLIEVPGAGHELKNAAEMVARAFQDFFNL